MGAIGKGRYFPISIALLAVMTLLLPACAGGIPQKDYDDLKSRLQIKEKEISQLQQQLAGVAPSVVIQAGQAISTPAAAKPTGWDTDASIKGGVKLISAFDSSGPAAWDAAAHPLVFITSEGKGYAGTVSKTFKLAGLQIVDANTHKVVTSASFDLGYKVMGTPHGLGISPDGKWLYVPTGEGDQPWTVGRNGRVLVVNARTLKLDKVLSTGNEGPHHIKGFTDWKGMNRVLVEAGQTRFLLDPDNDHKVVMTFSAAELHGLPYQSVVDPSGKYIYSGLVLGSRTVADKMLGAVGKIDLETGKVKFIPAVGMYPNGFAFTSDGKFTYVSDSAGDRVYKIDNATDMVVGSTQAGVPGPYGLALNWDETQLWAVGKGEFTFNLGGSLGLVDTRTFQAVREFHIGGQTIDHATIHPDSKANELWITSSGTLETIVFDMAKREVKLRIPSANGGDTHSGGFVRYAPDFSSGELLADQGGIHGGMLAQKRDLAIAIASGIQKPSPAAIPSRPENPVQASAAAVLEEGKLIFAGRAGNQGCAYCHGADGRGKSEFGAPPIRGATEETVKAALATRVQMRSIKLSEQEIKAVAAYLQSLERANP